VLDEVEHRAVAALEQVLAREQGPVECARPEHRPVVHLSEDDGGTGRIGGGRGGFRICVI